LRVLQAPRRGRGPRKGVKRVRRGPCAHLRASPRFLLRRRAVRAGSGLRLPRQVLEPLRTFRRARRSPSSLLARRSSSSASLPPAPHFSRSASLVLISVRRTLLVLSRCVSAVLTSPVLVLAASSSSLVVGRRSSSCGPAFYSHPLGTSCSPALALQAVALTPLLLAASSSLCRPASSTTSSS